MAPQTDDKVATVFETVKKYHLNGRRKHGCFRRAYQDDTCSGPFK